jgi:hypothetical protein
MRSHEELLALARAILADLRDLRTQAEDLRDERHRLVEEMRRRRTTGGASRVPTR